MLTKEEKAKIMAEYGRVEKDTGSPEVQIALLTACLLYTSPSPRDTR